MRALLVDSDKDSRSVLRQVLCARGHEVTEAFNAEAALAAHRAHAFPLIVVDAVLPGMNGLELSRRVRKLPSGEEPVIILLTEGNNAADVVSALDAGVSDYVAKPIENATLDTRLTIAERTVLERARRKLAEEALQSSEASYRALIEGSPDAIIVHRHGRIVYVNPAGLAVLGYDRLEDLRGRAYLDLLDTHEHQQELKEIHDMLARGEQSAAREQRFLTREGRIATLEVVAIPLEFDGEPAVVALARDLSERKRMEEQLMLADRMVSVGTLAAGTAHEINNPLAYVISNLHFIADELFDLSRELPAGRLDNLGELVAQAEDGAERVRLIVKDLKSFSRADEEATGPVDVHRVIDSAISMAWNEIRHRAQLAKHYDEVSTVKANEAKLGQVFLNLLLNAAQSLPVGNAAEHTIAVKTHTDDIGRVVVEVQDTGSGIPEEVRHRIFDPFFTTKPVGVGTGLGLSICHNIITAAGGEIEVRSEPGDGTTIRLALPAVQDTRRKQSPTPQTVTLPLPDEGVRILIIDDEPGVARSLRRALRDHDVTIALSGREAIEQLSCDPSFEVIFCDLMMPDVSGMELYEIARERGEGLEARMIFMTGGAFTQQARVFLESVPNSWVEKPFDIRKVQELVRRRSAA